VLTTTSASAAVIVRLAYVPTFRDPEFLYATVPIAIWSEVEMSLAITAGSLPTLRPLYRAAARKFSWKTGIFSTRRSYRDIDGRPKSGREARMGRQTSNRPDLISGSESERKIVNIDSESFVLEERKAENLAKSQGITRVTEVDVEFDEYRKL
jgi:hypothetical protein